MTIATIVYIVDFNWKTLLYVNRSLNVNLSVTETKSEVIKILIRENSKHVAETKI